LAWRGTCTSCLTVLTCPPLSLSVNKARLSLRELLLGPKPQVPFASGKALSGSMEKKVIHKNNTSDDTSQVARVLN
jgi:hypothetical protein